MKNKKTNTNKDPLAVKKIKYTGMTLLMGISTLFLSNDLLAQQGNVIYHGSRPITLRYSVETHTAWKKMIYADRFMLEWQKQSGNVHKTFMYYRHKAFLYSNICLINVDIDLARHIREGVGLSLEGEDIFYRTDFQKLYPHQAKKFGINAAVLAAAQFRFNVKACLFDKKTWVLANTLNRHHWKNFNYSR